MNGPTERAPEARCFSLREINALGPRFRRALDAVASNPSLFPATAFTFLAQYELSPGVVIATLPDISERATIRELMVLAAASPRLNGKIVRETINSVGLSMLRLGDEVAITSPDSPSFEISAAIIGAICGLYLGD